jgi:putative transposase
MIHRCIDQLAEKATTGIAPLCRVLGVSRSGYYAAAARARKPAMVCAATVHLQAAFAASGRSYGSRRLQQALLKQGRPIGRYRVRSLMRIHGLRPVWKRKFVHTTDSRHALPIADNLLNRQFEPATANCAWVSDITYIRTASGWLYLAAVMDLFSRKIVGWAMAPSMPAELVCTALQMAIVTTRPIPAEYGQHL